MTQIAYSIALREYLGPIISMIAAALSLFFFVQNRKLSRSIAVRSLNIEAQKMLFEIDKQLIADPRLWSLYDDHQVRKAPDFSENDLIFRAKQEAFAYLVLNMFEVVVFEARNVDSRENKNPSSLWCSFFTQTVAKSSIIEAILEMPESRNIYNPILLEVYREWKTKRATEAFRESSRTK